MSAEPKDTLAGHNATAVPGCMICEQMFATDRKVVLDTEHFMTYVSDVYPWGVMVATRRHDCDGPWALNDDEAVELGRMIPQFCTALKAAGNERVYFMTLGEDIPKPHYHLAFFARHLPISDVVHEVLYNRAKEETSDPAATARQFAADLRAHLS